jgi:hypothetical protein
MAERIFTELEADPDAIAAAIRSRIGEVLPGVDAPPNTLEGVLVDSIAPEWATGVEIVADVLDTILNEIGRRSGVVQDVAQPASGTVTLTADGRQPYVLPAGSTMQATAANQSVVELATTLDTAIPAGSPVGTPVTVTGVPVHATEDGTVGNGLVGTVSPDQAYVWLNSIALEGPTSDGTDGEDDDEYLNKTTREMQLNSSQVIAPEDVGSRVMSNPLVGGVTVLDLVDPTDPDVETANAVTVAVRDITGEVLSSGAKAVIAADLASRRETNFGLFLVDYNYTTVNVTVTVGAYPATIEYAEDQITAALQGWLSPLAWSQPPEEIPDDQWWLPARHVRIGEVVSVVDACSTVAYVDPSSILINGVAADLELSGLAPLTRPGAMTVTVTERIP